MRTMARGSSGAMGCIPTSPDWLARLVGFDPIAAHPGRAHDPVRCSAEPMPDAPQGPRHHGRALHRPPSTSTKMIITKNIGLLLLAIYLIISGVVAISGFSLGQASILMPVLAIAAGVLIVIGK